MAKLSAVQRHFEVALERHQSPKVRSRKLAAFALEKITEAKAINGRDGMPASHRQIVDGKEGAPLASVKPDGIIIARFDLETEVLEWIGAELLRASPVLSGTYAKSHVMFIDDVEREPAAITEPFREAVFLNLQPYARKIEGDIGRKPSSAQAPDGVYDVVAAMADKRFGNLARVYFGYRSFTGSKDRADRQPAIIVRPR